MTTQIENIPFDRLQVGMKAESRRLCVADDLYVFAHASGNLNPMHLPHQDGDGDGLAEAVAPSMWLAALISAVLGNKLPGPGTLYKSQQLHFVGQAKAGDTLVAKVQLTKLGKNNEVTFDTCVETESGTKIVEGEAVVVAPDTQRSYDPADVPGLTVRRHVHFDELMDAARPLPRLATAVVAPESAESLLGALRSAEESLITPILIGNAGLINELAQKLGKSLEGAEIIDESNATAAATRAVALVHEGRAGAVMKGHIHTDQFLHPILNSSTGLRTDRRLSHSFVMDVPGLDHLLIITDAAINIVPDLKAKIDIVQNAIDLARALGIDSPKVGILSAIETVNPAIPSTLDAAALSKMSDRGQITGGVVDGPLAMDNAVNHAAAATKGLKGLVAGRADVLVVPNLETGNMLAKQFSFIAHAEAGGIVMGGQVPIILNSRADDADSRVSSCAVAALCAHWNQS